MVPQRRFCCLLTVSNVCLNHMVLLGLKISFSFVLIRTRDELRKVDCGSLFCWAFNFIPPLSRWVLFVVFPFSFSSYHVASLFFLIFKLLFLFLIFGRVKKQAESGWGGKRKNPKLASSSFLPMSPRFHQALPLSTISDNLVYNIQSSFSKYWAPTVAGGVLEAQLQEGTT